MTQKESNTTGKKSSSKQAGIGQLRLKPPPTVPTRDTVLVTGEKANRILTDPVFRMACRSMVASLQDEMTLTLPDEHEKREQLYRLIHASDLMLTKLGEYVQAALQVNADELAAEEAARIENDENYGFH